MAECHDLFIKFDKKVTLDPEKKGDLRKSRNALRDKIKNYFSETLKVKHPSFYGQGSYMMNTSVNPLAGGEYDIDDGIYLEHMKELDEKDWKTPATVHNWIVQATQNHTKTPPKNKNTCVRVIYVNDYHIDFPIYVKKENESPKLAHLSKGWIYSDPKAFTQWFLDEVKEKGDQLKRLVRYLKAWKDNNEGTTKLPSGMILTVLATNYYVSDYPDQDDPSLIATVKAIHEALSENFSIKRPIHPNEELFEDWSDTRKDNFLNKLAKLIEIGQSALEIEDKVEASKKWIKVFGDRFEEYEPIQNEEKTNKAVTTNSPAILGNHGRSS